jgi:hypothetical protein
MKGYSAKTNDVGAIFHKWGISKSTFKGKRGRNCKSLTDTLHELGHVGRTIDIFKIDCEGCIPNYFESGVELRQILIELHSKKKKMPNPVAFDFFEAMHREGDVIFHKEINIRFWHVSQCIEYAFLKLHKDFFAGILPELE